MTKTLLSALLIFTIATAPAQPSNPAQPPNRSTFTIRGQEWEYRNYFAAFGRESRNKDGEVTGFLYKVVDVKDSAGFTISYITKTGSAAINPALNWRRDFVLRSDSESLVLPVDYYMLDTIYRCDRHNDARNKKIYSTMRVIGDNIRYPVFMTESTPLHSYAMQSRIHIIDPQYSYQQVLPNTSLIMPAKMKYGMQMTRQVVGTEKVSTDAGEFDCFKILVHMQVGDSPGADDFQEYYCPGIGVVRSRDAYGNMMELTRIKYKG